MDADPCPDSEDHKKLVLRCRLRSPRRAACYPRWRARRDTAAQDREIYVSSKDPSPQCEDRLVAAVQTLSEDRTRFVSGLWEIDPAGEREALRLTRSGKGESGPAFGPDGVLYFLSE